MAKHVTFLKHLNPLTAVKIVLTGGVYAGKTTTLCYLKEKGYVTIPEAAMQVIADLKVKLGETTQKSWMMANFTDFQTLNVKKQIAQESKVTDSVIFLDRGLLDYVAFCELRGYTITDTILQLVKHHDYDKVFVFDVLEQFDTRSESGRVMDKITAQKLVGIAEKTYQRFGYDTIRVPNGSVKQRAEFILDFVQNN